MVVMMLSSMVMMMIGNESKDFPLLYISNEDDADIDDEKEG